MGLLSCLKACFTSQARDDDNISNVSSVTNGSIRGETRNGTGVISAQERELQRAYQEARIAEQLQQLTEPAANLAVQAVALVKTETEPADMGWIVVEQINASDDEPAANEAPDTATFQLVNAQNKPIGSPFVGQIYAKGSTQSKASVGSTGTVPDPNSDFRVTGVETKFDPRVVESHTYDTYNA